MLIVLMCIRNKRHLFTCLRSIVFRLHTTDSTTSLDVSTFFFFFFAALQPHSLQRLSQTSRYRSRHSQWPCLSTILFMQFFVSANPSTTCCDSISRSVSDGTAGGSQTAAAAAAAAAASFCCPSYENRLLASSRTELNAALGMYGSPYAAAAAASQNYANYFPYSTDPSAIYSSLVGSYTSASIWCVKRGGGGEEGGSGWSISSVLFFLFNQFNASTTTSRLILQPVVSLLFFETSCRSRNCHWGEGQTRRNHTMELSLFNLMTC